MESIAKLWTDSSRLSGLNDYLSWIGWIVTFVGVALTALSIIVGQRVSRLNAVEDLARAKKIEALESATRPKSIKERLVICLDAIDPQIIPALKQGNTKFHGKLKPWQFADLQKLSAEAGSTAFMSFRVSDEPSEVTSDGILTPVEFTLTPELVR